MGGLAFTVILKNKTFKFNLSILESVKPTSIPAIKAKLVSMQLHFSIFLTFYTQIINSKGHQSEICKVRNSIFCVSSLCYVQKLRGLVWRSVGRNSCISFCLESRMKRVSILILFCWMSSPAL